MVCEAWSTKLTVVICFQIMEEIINKGSVLFWGMLLGEKGLMCESFIHNFLFVIWGSRQEQQLVSVARFVFCSE